MKTLSVFLGTFVCTIPLLHGQSGISNPPVEIAPTAASAVNQSNSTSSLSPWHGTRRERRIERRVSASVQPVKPEPLAISPFADLDANKDGKVSLPEFLQHERELADKRAKSSFHELDRNHDGQLTGEELSPNASSNQVPAQRPRRFGRDRADAAATPAPVAESQPSVQKSTGEKTPPPMPPAGGAVEIAPPPSKH